MLARSVVISKRFGYGRDCRRCLYRRTEELMCQRKKNASTVTSSTVPWSSYDWLQQSSNDVAVYKNFINGEFVSSESPDNMMMDVIDPATNQLVAKVPQTTLEELEYATSCAEEAFVEWRNTPLQVRQRVMLHFQHLIRHHQEDIAKLITAEQGKTLTDAMGDVFRGLEVVESTCHMNHAIMGTTLMNLGTGIDCSSHRLPLGVCAGIGTWEITISLSFQSFSSHIFIIIIMMIQLAQFIILNYTYMYFSLSHFCFKL